jgi:hypothetical protein
LEGSGDRRSPAAQPLGVLEWQLAACETSPLERGPAQCPGSSFSGTSGKSRAFGQLVEQTFRALNEIGVSHDDY